MSVEERAPVPVSLWEPEFRVSGPVAVRLIELAERLPSCPALSRDQPGLHFALGMLSMTIQMVALEELGLGD